VNPEVYGFDGDQSTGGSMTIRECWLPLRKAGAVARSMLVAAAARSWGVSPSSCHAMLGHVIHGVSGRRLGYGGFSRFSSACYCPRRPGSQIAQRFQTPGSIDAAARYAGQDDWTSGLRHSRSVARFAHRDGRPVTGRRWGGDGTSAYRVRTRHPRRYPASSSFDMDRLNAALGLAQQDDQWDRRQA
jgi:CO/xanthine dehydrogenase Mo-binding subunit